MNAIVDQVSERTSSLI